MINNISQTLAEKYDRDTLSVVFPDVLDDLMDKNASLEMISSKNLQRIKLIYSHNIVTHSVATIFVHTYLKAHYIYENEGDPEITDINYDNAQELAEKAAKLFKEELKFLHVNVFTNLAKEQMIEQMDSLQ